jgi:hypothetical protein
MMIIFKGMKDSRKRIEHYKMLYRAYRYLIKVDDICLEWPGELSTSEIQDLARIKSSFALGMHNALNYGLSVKEQVTAHKELQKEIKEI